METHVLDTKQAMGRAAAEQAARFLKDALAAKDRVRFVAATGASQFEFLEALTAAPGVDWSRTTMFHLDEYVGLPEAHPASFRGYLRERLIDKVHPGEVHLIDGDAPDAAAECRRVGALLDDAPIDVAFVGIGENGHLAFNDPPADFHAEEPYLVVDLDEACRRQQLGEGWFPTFDDVPRQAISMSIPAIMKIERIVCTVPDRRKAQAVRDCCAPGAEVTPDHPASILQEHPCVHLFLDREAASLLP